MTVKDMIEKLMEMPLDANIVFAEQRYCGGGDECYDAASLDIWLAENGDVYITPDLDTEYIRYDHAKYGILGPIG